MTRQEFDNFVNSFNKEPGNYTREELITIGTTHAEQLSRVDKDWTALAKKVGYGKEGEAYRKWILNVRYARGTVPKNPKVLDDKTVEEVTMEDVTNSLTEQRQALYVQQQKTRDERTALNRSLRNEARLDEFKEYFVEAVKTLKDLEPIQYLGKVNTTNSEAILMFSDWHIGQEANNFYNKFNVDIARQRVKKVVSDAIDYCKLYKIKRLHVLNLGDLVEGLINTNARVEQTEDVTQQLFIATELMSEALNLLQLAAPEITYRDVTDNHSRFTPDKHCSIARENFNRITTWFLKERLKNTSIKFMDDNLDIGLGRFQMDCGMKVAFMHGHEDKKDRALQAVVGATQDWTDVVCMGHWHNPAEHVYQNMRLFINGSLCGTGPYSLSNRWFTKPSQKLIIIDNNNFINLGIAAE